MGVLYYVLVFTALRFTSAGNASIVGLAEIFFSYLFFNVWKKDQMPIRHLAGAILMVLGALIVLLPEMHTLHYGDLLILLAVSFAPFGNYFTRKARMLVDSEVILFTRSSISAVFIIVLTLLIKIPYVMPSIRQSLFYLAVNGILILGYSKVLWVEGIHRINVVKANALASTSPVFTLFFAWLLLHNSPTIWQLSAFAPMFVGILLLGNNKKKS